MLRFHLRQVLGTFGLLGPFHPRQMSIGAPGGLLGGDEIDTGGSHIALQRLHAGICRLPPQQPIRKGAAGFWMSRQSFLSSTIHLEHFRMTSVGAVSIEAGRMQFVRYRRLRTALGGGDLGSRLRFQRRQVMPCPLDLRLADAGLRQHQERGSRLGDGGGQSASIMRRSV